MDKNNDSVVKMKKIRRQKRVSYVVLGFYFFMGGVEYAVILPSLWLYIHTKFGAGQWFLGLLLSAYSLAAMISGPLFGRWVDISRKPKLILVFSTFWEIGGNVMYFMGISPWFLFGSRLVSGTGAGGEAVILAEVARVTTEEERTGILSTLISVRQIGLLVGPGLNLFLRLANFNIGPFLVDKFSSPGAFMACVWLIETLLLLILYTDLHIIKEEEKQSENSVQAAPVSKTDHPDYATYSTNEDIQYDSIDQNITGNTSQNGYIQRDNSEQYKENEHHKINNDHVEQKVKQKLTWEFFKREYIREEIMALIAVQFISFFSQISLEVVSVLIMVRILSKRLKDRTMILIGLFTLVLANGWLCYFVPVSNPDTPSENIAPFAVGVILDMFALPFLVVCSVSLYSKLTAKETQAL
ncbi:hypothetical protein KUTeg_001762 [Tegillarca granosa]|uniref:Major facilitator superfamily domain-containing protein 8 n=1 Tax=Tegillarca granosa TaxID=220873 RepID=A0ABQ9FWQ0_TEGGR|nr:hypothetical protein KUTeg_001762 [Tegillarca granosa]